MQQAQADRLQSELVLGLDGERDKRLCALFEVVRDALAENDSSSKKLAFAYCLGLAKVFPEMCVGYTQDGEQCTKAEGWTLVYRDADGYSLWYMQDMDLLALQRIFYF